jgi:hypothetical protein
MITSQRLELPSEINIYYATWTRLWLCAHSPPFGHPVTMVVWTSHLGGYAQNVIYRES